MFNQQGGFDFGSLSLKGIKAATGGAVLPKGRYVCEVKDAKIEDTKDKTGKMLVIRCVEQDGKGVITDRFNIKNKSAEATRIGLEQMRRMLEIGGHPDPDNVGALGLSAINGLIVGIVVGTEKYEGEDRSKVTSYINPADVLSSGAKPAAAAGSIGGDVPF
jgi:hypothetical protein